MCEQCKLTETLSEGLKREYKVVVPAAELDAKVNERLDELKGSVRINGFRPGKVPVAHLKRVYGRSAMAEVIETTVRDANNQIVSERGFKLAAEPKVTLPSEEGAIEQLIAGKSDLNYTMALEIVPPIELADFKTIKLDQAHQRGHRRRGRRGRRRASPSRTSPIRRKAAGEKAAKDDRVIISFAGTIDGKPFEGGTGEDAAVLIGSNTFIPGFEDQLIGIAAGETRTVKVTFPAHYQNEHLAGKDAEFAVTAKSVETPGKVDVDDEFAKSLGLESLDKLRDAVKDRLAREHAGMSRQKLKRALLDELDKRAQVRAAADAGRGGIRPRLEVGAAGNGEREEDLRRRGHHRGKSQSRIPRHLRAARAAWSGDRRDRREEQHHRDRRRIQPRGDGACAPISRPGAAGVGLLPAEPAGGRRPARADLSRKRWSTSCSSSPVTEKKVAREELYKEDDDSAA